MKDIAKLAVGLYQPVFAQESFYPIRRFLSGDACLLGRQALGRSGDGGASVP